MPMALNNKCQYALLGMLNMRSMSGYELKKMCDNSIGFYWSENYGNIYPALRDMESQGWVEMEELRGEKSPRKKVYTITNAGLKVFQEWMLKVPDHRRLREELLLQVGFGHLTEPDNIAEKLKLRRDHCGKVLAELENVRNGLNEKVRSAEPSQKSIAANIVDFNQLTIDFGLKFYTMEKEWCEESLEKLLKFKGVEDNAE